MIVKEEMLGKLRRYFSLNLYEVKIWTALLSQGVSTAGELSDIANVPRSRSYDVLESLEKKGFVILKLGKPIKYLAVAPNEVIERVKKKIKQDTESKIKIINRLKSDTILNELNFLYKTGAKSVTLIDLSGIIKGRNNVYNHLEFMLKKAKKSVLIATTEQGVIRKLNRFKDLFKKLKDNDISLNLIAPTTKQSNKSISLFNVRNTNTNSRFCVIDGREVLVILSNDKEVHPNFDSAVWFNAPEFALQLEKSLSK